MQEQPRNKGGAIRLIISLIILVLALFVFYNRQYLIDSYHVWQYKPDAEIQRLVDVTSMSDEGEFYFYASRPVLNDRDTFNNNCTQAGEQSVVLGCYSGQRIYLFNVVDTRLDGVKEVTAAHEMLHAAYERLSVAEKKDIDFKLEEALKGINDQRIKDLISLYGEIEPDARSNEMHSILATELEQLPPDLETYYQQYFTDRQAIVTFSQQYEAVFEEIKSQQSSLVQELMDLSARISDQSDQYNADVVTLNQDIVTFNARANANGYQSQAAFDQDKNQLQARQNALAATRDTINSDTVLYQEKLRLLQTLNGEATQLNQSIDSKALEPPPTL